MGDNWEHAITVEDIHSGDPDTKYPHFIEGAHRAPPEDVGGVPGFENFLDAMTDPKHEEHDELRQWYGAQYNPDEIDEKIIKRRVASIALRRAAGKAAYAKRRS